MKYTMNTSMYIYRPSLSLFLRHRPLSRARMLSLSSTSLSTSLDGMKDIPTDLLNGLDQALVLWDVENVQPCTPPSSIPTQVHRFKRIISHLSSPSSIASISINAALNKRTLSRFKGTHIVELLIASGVDLSTVSSFSDAADRKLIDEAYSFIQEHQAVASREEGGRGRRVLMLISNDKGFTEMIEYAESKGIFCIHLAPPHRLKPWDLALPSSHQSLRRRSELASASSLALVWQAHPCLLTPDELKWSQECHSRARIPLIGLNSSLSAPGVVTHASLKC